MATRIMWIHSRTYLETGQSPQSHRGRREEHSCIFHLCALCDSAVMFASGPMQDSRLHSLPMPTKAYAAQSATSPLAPYSITRREPQPTDVAIDILYCGVCHSDLHFARNEWGMSQYPIVPGHEILGKVVKV